MNTALALQSQAVEASDIGHVRVYCESGLAPEDGPTAGDRVTVRPTTNPGATIGHVLTVPDTLAEKTVVEL